VTASTLDRPAEDQLTFVSYPIEKFETTGDGDLLVYGKATDGTVDTDEQIVEPSWSAKAMEDWFNTGANVRVQHNAQRDPAGVGVSIDLDKDGGHWLKALVVEPTAQRLVSKGVLRAFSVGISRPVVQRDVSGKARGGIIKGGEFAEISLVDRPANRNCAFALVKADKDGAAEWVGKMEGDEEFIAKQARPATPADVARAVKARRDAGEIRHLYSDPVAQRLADALAAEEIPAAEKRVTASGRVVDSSGQDRSDVSSGDFAGPGKTFPIETPGDVSDAASLAHHAKNPAKVRARIRSIARRKWPGKKLPPSLDGGDGSKAEFGPDEGIDVESVAKDVAGGVLAIEKAARFFAMDAAELKSSVLLAAGKNGTAPADDDDDDDDADDMPPKKGKAAAKGKKNPFGGKKAPAFGKKPDGDGDADDADDAGKAARLRSQIAQLQDELAKCTPTAPEAGGARGKDSDPAPLPCDPGSDCAGAIHPDQPWGKAMDRATKAPYADRRAHDATCCAYDPAEVKVMYPALAGIGGAADAAALKEEALTVVASGDLDRGQGLLAAAKAAEYLGAADPLAVADAMAGLRKAFTDMYPSVRLSPGKIMPSQFKRPYISSGHANAPSPDGPTSAHDVASYEPQASDFRRSPITSGHEAPSPGSKGSSNPYPAGTPAGTIYRHAAEANAAARALMTIHDHYAAAWNGVCPMRPASGPVTDPALGAVKGKKKKKARNSAQPVPEYAPMDPVPSMPDSGKAAAGPEASTGDITVMLARVERQMKKLRAAHEEQIAELTKGYEERLTSQAGQFEALRRDVDELAGQADTAAAPVRSVVKAASGVTPALRRNLVDEAGEELRAQKLAYARQLAGQGDPVLRQQAEAQIRKMLSTD
jgi:hypothetical protein